MTGVQMVPVACCALKDSIWRVQSAQSVWMGVRFAVQKISVLNARSDIDMILLTKSA
jgi:hypothetical protein